MQTADNGDRVKLKCTGRVQTQEFFSTSEDKLLEFEIGKNEVMPGLEKAVLGMEVGQKKSFTVPPEEGFGRRRMDRIEIVKRTQIPDHIPVEVGKKLQIKFADGKVQTVTITEIDGLMVTLDANHPLAGHNLDFDIEVMEIS